MSEEKVPNADLMDELFVDQLIEEVDTQDMTSSMTREELDARIELIEAKADARMSRFEERIDQAIGEMRRERAEVKQDIKSLKLTVVITGITAVIFIVAGIAAFNATVLSNMIASFESGKNTGTSLSQIADRLDKVQDKLLELDKKPVLQPAGLPQEKN